MDLSTDPNIIPLIKNVDNLNLSFILNINNAFIFE